MSLGAQDFSYPNKLCRQDFFYLTALALCTFCINGISIGSLEFFRHTEADRTLIAWEMMDRRDYLLPHLLGSVILTKPPLYYWMLALAFQLLGGVEEWMARAPSVVASVLIVLGQYVFFRKLSATPRLALLSALVIGSGVSFLAMARLAEIDMVYAFFTAFALFGAYFSVVAPTARASLVLYLMLALGFLTKGPPVLFFVFAAIGPFFIWRVFKTADGGDYSQGIETRKSYVQKFFYYQSIGLTLFFVIVGAWLYLLSQRVGFSAICEQFRQEVLHRIISSSRHQRGTFFYVQQLLIGVLPWTPALLGGLVLYGLNFQTKRKFGEVFAFHFITLTAAVVMLSLAEGKSARYIFPVYVSVANLTTLALLELRGSALEVWFYRAGRIVGALVLGCLVGVAMGLRMIGSMANLWWMTGLVLSVPLLLLVVGCGRKSRLGVVVALVSLVIPIRFVEINIYSPLRNNERSVKWIAADAHQRMLADTPLYTIELYERWVNYYLKRLGRQSYRLTPSLVAQLKEDHGRVFLLLSGEDEIWRLEQLYYYDNATKLISEYQSGQNSFLLVETSANVLHYLAPKESFPTVPSPAYYAVLPDTGL